MKAAPRRNRQDITTRNLAKTRRDISDLRLQLRLLRVAVGSLREHNRTLNARLDVFERAARIE